MLLSNKSSLLWGVFFFVCFLKPFLYFFCFDFWLVFIVDLIAFFERYLTCFIIKWPVSRYYILERTYINRSFCCQELFRKETAIEEKELSGVKTNISNTKWNCKKQRTEAYFGITSRYRRVYIGSFCLSISRLFDRYSIFVESKHIILRHSIIFYYWFWSIVSDFSLYYVSL